MSELLARPRLHPQVRAFALEGEVMAFLGVLGPTVLSGRPYPRLAPLLDGRRSVEAIAGELEDEFGYVAVLMALQQLQEEGLLVEQAQPVLAGGSAPDASRWSAPPRPLRARPRRPSGIAVLRCADEMDPAVADYAARAGGEWLLVTLGADRAAIGPRFAPGRVPCLRSYVARRREIRGFEQYVEAHGRECTPARRDDTAGAIAAEAKARLAAYLRAGGGRPDEVWTLDLGRGDWSAHRVLPHQGCPHCTPAMVTSAFPGFSCDAEVAAQAPEIHRDGYSGIVSRICDYDAETAPGAVCAFAEHLFPPDAGRTDAVWRGFRRRSSGKGRTRSEARQSALLEAIERYCGAASGGEPVVRASQAELGPEAVDAARCMGFSEQQYQQREQTNPGAPTQAWVPERSDRHRRMDWVAAWSLTAGKKRYVPARFCFYGYPEAGGGTGTFADSNGCAAGATVADAMVRGMLELVERDAVGLWWYNRALRPAPVREEETAREIAAMTVAYEPAGREVALLDLTTDFGIPAAAALSWQRGSGACITLGFGADFEAQQALRRAIAEMNQFLPEALEQGEGRVRGADPQRDRYLRACASAPRTPAAAWSGGPEALMARWVAEAGERGYEVVVVNQTRPGVGVPVVKVIMPGLCHFWPRFGAARLYQAPVAMGWIGKPKAEAELNPARLLL